MADFVDGDDVRMIERAHRASFLFEATNAFGGFSEFGRKDFERDFATEPRIEGEIDLTHSASAERRDDLISSDLLPGRQPGRLGNDVLSRKFFGDGFDGWSFNKLSGSLIVGEQIRHFTAQFIIASASGVEKSRALFVWMFQRGVIKSFHFSPEFKFHLPAPR